MEIHSPVAFKKLWSYLRVVFFMMRKGLISKRKLIMDMNLMMKRGKLVGKTIGNLMFHHHHHHSRSPVLREYEFSCSNTPSPFFFHAKRRHNFFPCINTMITEEPDETPRPIIIVPRIEYSPQRSHGSPELELDPEFSVRVSNYSSGGEADDGDQSEDVNVEAEEFIRRFYEQLRVQRRTALLEYKETEFQEMLARGA